MRATPRALRLSVSRCVTASLLVPAPKKHADLAGRAYQSPVLSRLAPNLGRLQPTADPITDSIYFPILSSVNPLPPLPRAVPARLIIWAEGAPKRPCREREELCHRQEYGEHIEAPRSASFFTFPICSVRTLSWTRTRTNQLSVLDQECYANLVSTNCFLVETLLPVAITRFRESFDLL